jgi:glutamate dehydrogenase
MNENKIIRVKKQAIDSPYEMSEGYFNFYSKRDYSADINYLKRISANNYTELSFTQKEDGCHLKLFQLNEVQPLSKIIPELDKMGIYVIDKQTINFHFSNQLIWLSDFRFRFSAKESNLKGAEKRFKDALIRIWNGKIENDKINSLILISKLNWKEIVILRAYTKYFQQLGTQFDSSYMEKTLAENPTLSSQFIAYFKQKFNPSNRRDSFKYHDETRKNNILKMLDDISNPSEDRIMRAFFNLIQATVRTNYFSAFSRNHCEDLTFKFQMRAMPNLAHKGPQIETFVYSTRFEGLHMRSSLIARGGIRWSERADFGQEILGLMRTQVVKNSIIVPTGAKGGFLLKSKNLSRAAHEKEAKKCYCHFMTGLLSITDNNQGGLIVHPEKVVCYDEDDAYLVVAADKGTANFSDFANEIAKKFDFWLLDAFAAGGKTGYNHKKMGITAKSVWEAVKRHFFDLNIAMEAHSLLVIGIGDMSGDVFGNGLLLAKNIKLLAAFDHRHIFIDPHPDPLSSWHERMRLFSLKTSSWADYNLNVLSEGGGIFSRQTKLIPLNQDIKTALGIKEEALSPNDLIRAILKAPVDLLWNGGIGTFVKASFEDHNQAEDNANNQIRIDACELRCRVVAEGGNLGFTQAARIEYASLGGKINTDFIDNVGGVDCSDHEVNIKILLQHIKPISLERRNALLFSMQEEVSKLVLKNAHDQSMAISVIEEHSRWYPDQYFALLKYLEVEHSLNRRQWNLPKDEDLISMKSNKKPLLRPQIAVLLAHSKIILKEDILKSKVPELSLCTSFLHNYFPDVLQHRPYLNAINKHLLKRDIIATTIANDVINRMGITYVHLIAKERGIEVAEIVKIYLLIRHIFSVEKLQYSIECLEKRIPMVEQYQILLRLKELIRNSTYWFLDNEDTTKLEHIASLYKKEMENLYPLIPELIVGETQHYMVHLIRQLTCAGMPEEIATRISVVRALYASLNIIHVSQHSHFNLKLVASVYFFIGSYLDIVWFRDNLFLNRGEFWDNLISCTLRNKFDRQQQELTEIILQEPYVTQEKISIVVQRWYEKYQAQIDRWKAIVTSIKSIRQINLSLFFVAVEELARLTRLLKRQGNGSKKS